MPQVNWYFVFIVSGFALCFALYVRLMRELGKSIPKGFAHPAVAALFSLGPSLAVYSLLGVQRMRLNVPVFADSTGWIEGSAFFVGWVAAFGAGIIYCLVCGLGSSSSDESMWSWWTGLGWWKKVGSVLATVPLCWFLISFFAVRPLYKVAEGSLLIVNGTPYYAGSEVTLYPWLRNDLEYVREHDEISPSWVSVNCRDTKKAVLNVRFLIEIDLGPTYARRFDPQTFSRQRFLSGVRERIEQDLTQETYEYTCSGMITRLIRERPNASIEMSGLHVTYRLDRLLLSIQ